MTALIVLLALTLTALARLWCGFCRDAKRRAAKAHAERVAWVRTMTEADFDEMQRTIALRRGGATWEEIAQAEEDAQ